MKSVLETLTLETLAQQFNRPKMAERLINEAIRKGKTSLDEITAEITQIKRWNPATLKLSVDLLPYDSYTSNAPTNWCNQRYGGHARKISPKPTLDQLDGEFNAY